VPPTALEEAVTRSIRLAIAIAVVAVLSACSGDPVVTAADIEEKAVEEFTQQFPVDSVDCPEDLPAELGESIECVLVSEGTSFTMEATVNNIEDGRVDFGLELTEEL
jgi:hypothetical protein